ncbi:hypothetical protein AN219_37680 [Streptomyces nanshensis]|nr:hypothetical protein AN219_37680 [Streptomyces nanshensis]
MPKLSGGQIAVLILACVPMVAAGVAGGWGTYSNVLAEFARSATALGVVAAGEGVTLVLALVMVGLTMLGQSAPAPVRLGMWGAPLAAAVTGLAVADDATEAIVYAMTPMAMCASAEGLGLLARRIVVFRTGVDMEAQRRNAETVQRLNYHRARSVNHPTKRVRERSEKTSWRLAKRVGVGDEQLGASLVEVQRTRIREGADAALVDMFGVTPAVPELPPVDEPVKVERADVEPVEETPQPVIPSVLALPSHSPVWDVHVASDLRRKAPAVVAAEEPRQVVTETVTLTPADLRREARKLDRQAVKSTSRRVTIKTLKDTLGLSRRDATELRREVVEGARS